MVMSTRTICNILKQHGNCYVGDYPSDNKIAKIKKVLDCDLKIYGCTLVDGYIIEIVKKEVNTNGMGINTR